MPVTPKIGEKIVGLWRLRADGERHCYGLSVFPDSRLGADYSARLVHWKRGREGCRTRSSELLEIELTGERPSEGRDIRLTGKLPRQMPPHQVDAQLVVSIAASGDAGDGPSAEGAEGILTVDGDSHRVVLEGVDFLAHFHPID